MVAVISWWALDGYCHFLVGQKSEAKKNADTKV